MLRWDVATAALGVSFVVLVSWHGSTVWRVTRMAVVIALTFGALWLEHRRSTMLRSMSGLATGVVGTSAGLGIGLIHVAKSDLDVIAIAGLVALVAGLYLLVAASCLLIRTTPGWWRILAIAAVVLVFQLVLEPFSIGIYATNLPSIPLGSATPADRGFAYHNVTLATAGGVHLAAWFIPSTDGAAVVLLHGAGVHADSVLGQASSWSVMATGSSWSTPGVTASGGYAQDNGWVGA